MTKDISANPVNEPQDFSDFPEILTTSDIQTLLQQKEKELKILYKEALDLLGREHGAGDTEKMQRALLQKERALVILYEALDETAASPSEAADDSDLREKLRTQCSALMEKGEKLDRRLADDRNFLQQKEFQEAIDPIKVAMFVVGFPAAVVTFVKALFGDKSPVVTTAAEVSAIFGAGYAFRKQIKSLWKATGRAVCNGARNVRESFVVHYVTEQAHEKAAAVRNAFSSGAKAVTQRFSKIPEKIRRLVHRPHEPMGPSQ